MKIRTGFVSNSSSLSFICLLCKRRFKSLTEDPEIRQCEKGHIFCRAHTLDDYESVLDAEYNLAEKHRGEGLYDSMYLNIPSEFCPICQKIEIPDEMILEYIQRKYDLTKEQIKDLIRNE